MRVRHLQTVSHFIGILLLAFVLRHYGWNWDGGQQLHPDERHLATVTESLDNRGEWFNTETSGFNPYNRGIHSYVYGLLPIRVVHALTVSRGETDRLEIIRVGRLCSALWSCGTVGLVFLLGWRLVSARFASTTALLMTFTVLSIQQAHFFTVDSAGVFFSTLCCALGLTALKENRGWLLLPAGGCVGLAMACRLNLGLLALWMIALSLACVLKRRTWTPLLWLGGGGALALLLFRICQPNAFAATGFMPGGLNPRWLQDLSQVRMISEGRLEVPFTLQWTGRIPWLYALGQILVWGMGLPLGALALGGSGWLLWKHRAHPSHWQIPLVLWPLMLILYHGGVFLHTLRYFLPAYPMLILGGVLALRRIESVELRRIFSAIALGGTALYAAAFMNMYRQEHPRIEASRWLLDQLSAGGAVVSEHWDRPLPLYLPGAADTHSRIRFEEMEVYTPESPEKIRSMLEQIDRADYLVLSSTRASHTLPRMPLRYPVMTDFYRRLAEGETRVGLREVARFQRAPELPGWRLNTLHAEEALRVYDHPLVRIYEKTPVFSVEALEKVLTDGVDFEAIPGIPYLQANRGNDGWLNPEQWEKRREGEIWHRHFPPESFGNRAPLPVWVLALWLLAPLAFPFTFFLFPTLRDRGASVSRLLGLLGVSILAWWPAAIGWMPFGRSLLIAVMLLAGGAAWMTVLHFERYLHWLRGHWKLLLWGEGLQWSVFAVFLILRILQPDLWHPWAGGEKPMDFAYLNATVLTPYFPPPNPWLSGAFLNYYYFGFVLFASLIRMTGISPDLAYNLALPTCALFIAGGATSISAALFPWIRSRPGWRGWRVSSLLTVTLVLFAGNLGQLREFLKPGKLPFLRDVYWNASRVIGVPPGEAQPITEFPLFSLLYGDLHAHLMALPVSMLCLLGSWQLFRRFHPLRVIFCGVLLGALQVINTWDFPIQTAIFLYCLFAGAFPVKNPWPTLWGRTGWALCGWLTVRLSFAPFHWHHLPYPAEVDFWPGPRSGLLDLVLAHGLFLLPIAGGCWLMFRGKFPRSAPLRARLFPMLLLAGCLAVIVLVEFFSLAGDAGRMNMVFKFYFQVWWMLAVLTAPVVVAVWGKDRHGFYAPLCIGLLALSLLYTVTAVPAKLKDRYWPTEIRGLDGLAYLQHAEWTVDGATVSLAGDRRAIAWLRGRAKPFDVLMEAQRPEYQWGGRISWHTGLPAVLGWEWHMRQQRSWPGGGQAVTQRKQDVRRFYTRADPEILRRYRVRYVIAGELERITYGEEAIARLETIPHLHPVFEQPGIRIFEYLPSAGNILSKQ